MNNKLRRIREWINRDDGKWLRAGNYKPNGLEIIAYLLFAGCFWGVYLAKKTANDNLQYILVGLGVFAIILGIYGNLKNEKDKL